jgi:hypothetical protein
VDSRRMYLTRLLRESGAGPTRQRARWRRFRAAGALCCLLGGCDDSQGSEGADDSGSDDGAVSCTVRSHGDAASGGLVGDDCYSDDACCSGVCWDYSAFDSACVGRMCSVPCIDNAECVAAAREIRKRREGDWIVSQVDRSKYATCRDVCDFSFVFGNFACQ